MYVTELGIREVPGGDPKGPENVSGALGVFLSTPKKENEEPHHFNTDHFKTRWLLNHPFEK